MVHCAGRGGDRLRIVDKLRQPGDLDSFAEVIRVNLVGTYNVLRLAAARMAGNEPGEAGERGAIILTASVAAFDGQIGQASYSASKGAIVGMTLPIARDLAVVGVRVNTIAPGLIDTPIYGEGPGSEAFKDNLKRDVLFPRRLGTADEFASLAVEVLANSYLNAEVIRLDGGARLQPK
jgi:NAD(P)-dependent dehydrogenase (short-subunit alcohol dehydrogenase family)